MTEDIIVRAWNNYAADGISIFALKRARLMEGRKKYVPNVLEWREIEDPAAASSDLPMPLFVITRESAQALADDLWTMGIKPREASATQGHLQAMEAHLKDLQRLVFEKSPAPIHREGETGE